MVGRVEFVNLKINVSNNFSNTKYCEDFNIYQRVAKNSIISKSRYFFAIILKHKQNNKKKFLDNLIKKEKFVLIFIFIHIIALQIFWK